VTKDIQSNKKTAYKCEKHIYNAAGLS